tara:strand:- start:1055 stop:2716 length:1662 start_codon:yes stop_codon:yes gene_type:complete
MLDVATQIKAQERMHNARSPFEAEWTEAAQYFLPRQADFSGQNSTQGVPRTREIFDSYPARALDDGKSIAVGMVMPRGALFQGIAPPDHDELLKLQHVAAWYEAKTRRLFELRHDPNSGFVQQTDESWASLMAFGNQGMSVTHRIDKRTKRPIGLRYRSEHIGRCYIERNWQGLQGRTHRKWTWTAEQALERWGREKLQRAPQVLEAATNSEKKHTEFDFLLVALENPNVDPERMDMKGKPYIGGYISLADKEWIEQGGWNSRELTYSAFMRSPSEDYGRGPGVDMLPEAKALQQIMVDLMTGAEMGLMPPLGGPDDALDMIINYGAGEFVPGAFNYSGNQVIGKLFDVGDFQGPLAIQAQLHEAIDRAFFRHLLFLTQDMKSHVTDAQIMERVQEKGVLLQPLATQETEWLSPMLDREIDLMGQMGEFDDMPGEVIEAGGARAITYDNPLNAALMSEEAAGYFRMSQAVATQAQYDPTWMQEFNRMFPAAKVMPNLARVLRVPAAWQATEAELKAADDAAAQRQNAQDLLETGAAVAGIAKDLGAAGVSGNA